MKKKQIIIVNLAPRGRNNCVYGYFRLRRSRSRLLPRGYKNETRAFHLQANQKVPEFSNSGENNRRKSHNQTNISKLRLIESVIVFQMITIINFRH